MEWDVSWKRNSLYLPQMGLWLDARFPTDAAFVSHAHFDHLAAHRRILCSEGTARLMAARMPGKREELILPFGQDDAWDEKTRVRLHPAGHILGSAQLWAEREGSSLLYTGDFKLRPGVSAERCETPPADVVIMETTYGLPRYVLPPTAEVLGQIVDFCRQTLEDGEVPVLFGYSLGKSQELLGHLAGAGLPLMVHSQTARMTRVYEGLGRTFPAYRDFDLKEVRGQVVVCPPQSAASAWLQKIKPRRTAMITGWAMDPRAVYRYQTDAAFPLSDHADFNELLEFVERVNPRRVLTVHGFAREFAQTLRDRGVEAWALGWDNQLEFRWPGVASAYPARTKTPDSASPQTAEAVREARSRVLLPLQKLPL